MEEPSSNSLDNSPPILDSTGAGGWGKTQSWRGSSRRFERFHRDSYMKIITLIVRGARRSPDTNTRVHTTPPAKRRETCHLPRARTSSHFANTQVRSVQVLALDTYASAGTWSIFAHAMLDLLVLLARRLIFDILRLPPSNVA